MLTSLILLVVACASSIVSAAPANALDNATLLQNGLDAQALNAEFATISAKDACDSGQMACIDGAPALCQFGAWQTQSCSDSRECFALPLVKEKGTTLGCTSYANALSLISATGAQGGLTPANSNSTTVPLPTMTPITPSAQSSVPPSVNTSAPSGSSSPSPVASSTSTLSATPSAQSTGIQIVTVTVTVSSTSTSTPTVITLPPVTTTLSPAEASQILSSLSANGAVTNSLSSITPTSTPAGVQNALASPSPAASSATPVAYAGYRRSVVVARRRGRRA